MTTMPAGYYNRHDDAKNYEEHLFIAGSVLQSAEVNEIQRAGRSRLKAMGDALFRDGDVVRDCQIIVNSDTGATTCESGAVYLQGAVRGVPSRNFTIPIDVTVAVGVWLIESVVTDIEDPDLRDPAAETANYNEPGAQRLKVQPQWGYESDGTDGQFYPIYYVDAGQLRAKEAPPVLDSVSQAIARYDRDSAGSNYVVSGLKVTQLDDAGGNQVYSVDDGRARVNGFGVTLSASRRIVYPATPDLRYISNEPKASTTTSTQRINVDRGPIDSITSVSITKQKTVTLTHGAFTGAQDPLPDTSVVSIQSVTQGGTTYVQGTDYQLTAGKVDWSLPGAEPATGSSYSVTYRYITTVAPESPDLTGFSVTGAVVGTLVLTSYYTRLPRIDRLCLSETGEFVWIAGVSTDYNPVRPGVPSNLCPIAQVLQTWDATRRVINDGVRVVPMADIEQMNYRMDLLTDLIAQQKLAGDINQRESAAKKSLFVDPFLDDLQRDQGIAQTAAIVDGVLTLPIDGDAHAPTNDISSPQSCDFTLTTVISQPYRTGNMKINPYNAFGILPSQVTLNPPVDRWTEVQTEWASPVTRVFVSGSGGNWGTQVSTRESSSAALIKTTTRPAANLRSIDIHFTISGFGPGENLSSITFDGIAVTPLAP